MTLTQQNESIKGNKTIFRYLAWFPFRIDLCQTSQYTQCYQNMHFIDLTDSNFEYFINKIAIATIWHKMWLLATIQFILMFFGYCWINGSVNITYINAWTIFHIVHDDTSQNALFITTHCTIQNIHRC